MLFWKLDDETIRCLINKEEIDQMGFDLEGLRTDDHHMEEFLDTIIQNSRQYINWNTENGMQTYSAKELPSEQLLLTISCTFADAAIDRDLAQIQKMSDALMEKTADERIQEIYQMKGEEKEIAFEDLANDLRDIFLGNFDESESPHREPPKKKEKDGLFSCQMVFADFDLLLLWSSIVPAGTDEKSVLYKAQEKYHLLIRWNEKTELPLIEHFIDTAGEYGASYLPVKHEEAYLEEHGEKLISDHALFILQKMK